MNYEWFRTNEKPRNCSEIFVIVRRFDGEFLIKPAMFFQNIDGNVVYLFEDNWLDFNRDIIGWCYYPKLPGWAREEAERKTLYEERD